MMRSLCAVRWPPRSIRHIVKAGHAPPAELIGAKARAIRSALLIDPEWRQVMVTLTAYHRAEQRGFEPGHELEDWLFAEHEIDAALAASHPGIELAK